MADSHIIMDVSEAARRVLSGDTRDPDVWHALQAGSDEAGRKYYLLLSAIGRADSLKAVPDLLKLVIKSGSWQKWRWVNSEFSAPSLDAYITKPPPKGIGATRKMVEELIKDDAEALALYRRHTTAPVGRRWKQVTNGSNATNKRTRGRSYALDRLERERPGLFEEVNAGRLSANAAAIQAGFRKQPSPVTVLRNAWKRASDSDRQKIRKDLEEFLQEITL